VRFFLAAFAAFTFVPAEVVLPYEMPRARNSTVVRVYRDKSARHLPRRFLSVALDTAHVVGAPFWGNATAEQGMVNLADPTLRRLAAAIGPSYLRVGGTDADRVVYDLRSSPTPSVVANGVKTITAARWGELADFATAIDFQLMFTLNFGPASRDENGDWDPDSASALVAHARRRGDPVAVWEAGNELNAFLLLHKQWLRPSRYVTDVSRLRDLIARTMPGARVAGPAVAFWPGVGEGIPFMNAFLSEVGGGIDIVTWHYYPTQSSHCPVSTSPALPDHLLTPYRLDEIKRWTSLVKKATEDNGHPIEIWLGETGSAQCGGESGYSDTFASSFWWLDELGLMARSGQAVVIRQALIGGAYGLIDLSTLRPRPDYWATLLWRRLMGPRVLDVASRDADQPLRVYAHCTADASNGAVTILLMNLHGRQSTRVFLPDVAGPVELYDVSADSIHSGELRLGRDPLKLGAGSALPELRPEVGTPALTGGVTSLVIQPESIVFAVFRDADLPACH